MVNDIEAPSRVYGRHVDGKLGRDDEGYQREFATDKKIKERLTTDVSNGLPPLLAQVIISASSVSELSAVAGEPLFNNR
jgi:hypothetical protein